MESRVSLPTIAGYELSYQWVLLGSSKDTFNLNIGLKFMAHLDLTKSLQFNEDLQLDGPHRRIGGTSQHQYANFALELEGSGEAKYNGQEVNLRLWLKPLPENHTLLDFKINRFMYAEESILELKPDTYQLRVRYESPQLVNSLLGLKWTTQMNMASRWFSWPIPSKFTLRIHHFHGLEQTVQLKFGNSLLGSLKRIYVLFRRPGRRREQGTNNDHVELLLHSDALNETTNFIHCLFVLPFGHEVTTTVEINQNGIIHARANVTGSPWELYGNHNPTAQQTMFTAQLLYPQGEGSLVFRGNLTDNFKLFLHNRDDERPFHLQMTQRFLLSRHHHYPMFRRIHQETVLQMLNNQTIDLQLEWNSGSRNGILEQGLAKLVHRSLSSETKMRFDLSWTEDVESSDLDSSVEGYARKLIVGCNFERTGFNSSDISIGVRQFMSRDFWMLHTNKPAIVSLYTWVNSEHSPHLNANSSLVWQFGYRLDKGGKTNAQATLRIPSKDIDAQFAGELRWRGHVKGSVPWLKHVEGYITVRVFPKQLTRFFEANFSHTLEEDVLTSVYLTLSLNEIYSIHSHLIRGQNLHCLRIEWPTLQTLEIETTYRLQLESKKVNVAITQPVKLNGESLALLHTAIYYEFPKRKFRLLFNASRIAVSNVRTIAYFSFGSELHNKMNFSPFNLNYVAACDVQMIVPLIDVDFGVQLTSTLQLTANNGLINLVVLHHCSEKDVKNGIDFNTSYDYHLDALAINSIFAIYLPNHGLLQQKRYAGWDFHLAAKSRERQITFEGSHASFGNLIFHEKYRKFVGPKTRFDGSAMFAVSPITPIRLFAGLYINYNYALKYSSNQYGIEFHGEYNPRSGTGPGTPLRLNVQFTHDGWFRYGTFELVLNSQALGYWTGYEMVTIMSKYTTEGIDSESTNRTWTCRSILGYRLLEGRGTRALESAVQLMFSPSGDVASASFRAGLPGNINQNVLECGYIFYPDRLQVRTTVVVWNHDRLNVRLSFIQNNNWETLKGEVVIKIPIIKFDFALSEVISTTDDTILKENTEITFCYAEIFDCKLRKEILIFEQSGRNRSDLVGQMTWYSTISWLGNGSLRTTQTITEKTKKQHLVTFLWNDRLIFRFDMIQSPESSTYNITGDLGNKQFLTSVNLYEFDIHGVKDEGLELHCKFPTKQFDFQLSHHSNYSKLSYTEKYLASQRFYLRTGLLSWIPVSWQQTFAQTRHEGSLQHISLISDIDTASAQFLHFTVNYTDDNAVHTKLLIFPEIISRTGLENITFALDTQRFHGANKDYLLSVFVQLKPRFPSTSGTLQVNLGSLECEDLTCDGQLAGNINSVQSASAKLWRVQGSMQRHGDDRKSLRSYHSLLNIEDEEINYRFTISFGGGPRAFFIFGNVTSEEYLIESDIRRQVELMQLQMNHQNNDTDFVSIFKLNILELPLLYVGMNRSKSETTHRISFDFNIGTSNNLTQNCELHMLVNKDSEDITFALRNGAHDNHAVTENDIYFKTNLFHILQKRGSPEEIRIILNLFETFLNTTVDFDHVFGVVNIIRQNNESLTGMVKFQELIGMEQETVQSFMLQVNSSMSRMPSSTFKASLQKFYSHAHDNLEKVIAILETEIENLLPKQHINLNLSLALKDEDPLILTVENLYIFPFRAVLQLTQTSNSYSYKHRIESFISAAESNSVYWNSTADCKAGIQIFVDCSIRQSIYGRLSGALLDLKPHTGHYAVAAIWDQDNHGIMALTIHERNNSSEFELQTPTRYLTLTQEKKQTVKSHIETIRWTVHSVPVDQTAVESEHRSAYMAITWNRMNAQNDTIHRQRFSGIELDSNFIRKNRIGATVNITCNDKSAALYLSSFVGENMQPKPALTIRVGRLSDSSVYLEPSVHFDEYHIQLTGIHKTQANHFNSALSMKLNEKLPKWNVSIDLWNKIYIMNNLGTEFSHSLNRNNKGLVWQQRAFIPGLIGLHQETRFNISPICITSHMSSMKGKANLLAWKPDHDSYLLELSHKPSSGHGRADAVVRFSESTNGQMNMIARWRPTLFEEALVCSFSRMLWK
ncbi:hypothetical protein P879_01125 [Paragonimus westermani]|uniref:VWFD domain-containing protein n=1 Tax=Paragonimus westermani TaxID=34504 RepID=A0A8T0DD11_9TREM|nr:hypothetical protein P879_01125 [Paragonimus westermani]